MDKTKTKLGENTRERHSGNLEYQRNILARRLAQETCKPQREEPIDAVCVERQTVKWIEWAVNKDMNETETPTECEKKLCQLIPELLGKGDELNRRMDSENLRRQYDEELKRLCEGMRKRLYE